MVNGRKRSSKKARLECEYRPQPRQSYKLNSRKGVSTACELYVCLPNITL